MAIKSNLLANYLAQGWSALLNLALIPVYIKYLGIESFGLIGLFAVMQAFLSLLDVSIISAVAREMGGYSGGRRSAQSIRDLLKSIEVIVFLIAIFIFVVIAIASTWITQSWLSIASLSPASVKKALVIMGLIMGFRVIEGAYRSIFIGLQRQVILNFIITIFSTIRGIGALLVLVWISPTIDAFFFWQGLISLLTLTVLGVSAHSILPLGLRRDRFSVHELRNIWSFANGVMCITGLSLILTQVDKLLLSKILSLDEYGYYALAATAASGLGILLSPIIQAYYPKFCELCSNSNEDVLIHNYHKGAQLVTVILGSSSAVLFFYSETILLLWTTNNLLVAKTNYLFRILILGNLLNCLLWIPYQMQLAHGWVKLSIIANIIAVLLIVPAIIVLVPIFGPFAAVWIWVSVNVFCFLIIIHFMHKRIMLREKWRWYYKDILLPLITSFLTVGFIKILAPSSTTVLLQIFILLAAIFSALITSGISANLIRTEYKNISRKIITIINKKFFSKYGAEKI